MKTEMSQNDASQSLSSFSGSQEVSIAATGSQGCFQGDVLLVFMAQKTHVSVSARAVEQRPLLVPGGQEHHGSDSGAST